MLKKLSTLVLSALLLSNTPAHALKKGDMATVALTTLGLLGSTYTKNWESDYQFPKLLVTLAPFVTNIALNNKSSILSVIPSSETLKSPTTWVKTVQQNPMDSLTKLSTLLSAVLLIDKASKWARGIPFDSGNSDAGSGCSCGHAH